MPVVLCLATRILGSIAMGLAVMDVHGGDMTPRRGHDWVRAMRAGA